LLYLTILSFKIHHFAGNDVTNYPYNHYTLAKAQQILMISRAITWLYSLNIDNLY